MKLCFPIVARAVALLAMLIAIPAATMAQSVSAGDGITVYNAQHASLTKAWVEAFH